MNRREFFKFPAVVALLAAAPCLAKELPSSIPEKTVVGFVREKPQKDSRNSQNNSKRSNGAFTVTESELSNSVKFSGDEAYNSSIHRVLKMISSVALAFGICFLVAWGINRVADICGDNRNND